MSKNADGRDYYEEIKINKFNLEQEWIEQGERAVYWAGQFIIAQREYNECDMSRKIMKATLGKKYRQELRDRLEKPTDKVVEELIRTDPDYRQKTEELIAA